MSDPVTIDIFVEDRAHEALLLPLVRRVAREEDVPVQVRVRSARGGHGRAIQEFRLFQTMLAKGAFEGAYPKILVVGIDGNCTTAAKKKLEITEAADEVSKGLLVAACPDPHVERWYLADPESFQTVVGHTPSVGKAKCARDHYKRLLSGAIQQGGHPATLGGIEFASELVAAMDFYRAGKNDHALRSFIDDLKVRLRAESTG